ncbi:MAG: hypothetical protein ACK5GN_12605 [Pseudomonadota bacterium]
MPVKLARLLLIPTDFKPQLQYHSAAKQRSKTAEQNSAAENCSCRLSSTLKLGSL